jgi:conjugative relaxase-like TrwC/TraI family protein
VGDRVSGLMLRVSTIKASSASASARYYTQYLCGAPGEAPGVWSGRQAAAFGLSGAVGTEQLERLLSGLHPLTGAQLGYPLRDRKLAEGRVVEAVSGFDATFSAPKSLSVWWALTGDPRLLAAHDVAVAAAFEHLDWNGSTTRERYNGRRLHRDSGGLMAAWFRQTTSRADDPQIHTHLVVSAKVQTPQGRWLALDARYLKRKQRMLGGLYQSVLRNQLTHVFGVEWAPIVNGQAEIAGFPTELLKLFSKRGEEIDRAMKTRVDEFRQREGRSPTRYERAAIERETSADTRSGKSGLAADELRVRWQSEAAEVGWTVERVVEAVQAATTERSPADSLTVGDVIEEVSGQRSSWGRPEVVQAICDLQRPLPQLPGRRWGEAIERAADQVGEHLVDLDPPDETTRRASDGRSLWIEPVAARYSCEAILAEEERIITWAIDAQAHEPAASQSVSRDGLDVLQGDATAAVAGADSLVLVVGPAGAGKTRMLATAVNDLHHQRRVVFGVAPTAKAARVLQRDTGMRSDTVAKLLHEQLGADRPPHPGYQLRAGATVVVDEAGMISTPALRQLVGLAEAQRWRLVLVGDPRQLQGVGRGGLFDELCRNGRVNDLERVHRFTHQWEAAASLLLRSGDPAAFDTYQAHDRIIPGTLDDHLERIANTWTNHHHTGRTLAVVASTNDHVDAINHAVQAARLAAGELDVDTATPISAGEHAHLGDVVVTRRNHRTLVTSTGDTVRNRETWTVTAVDADGSLTVSHRTGHGSVSLPAEYVRDHVRLGYAATEHGWQSDTVNHAIALVSPATTRRGLYVAATRGRDENVFCVVTDSDDVVDARDILDGIVALDRADTPAVTQRRTLAQQVHSHQPSPTPRCAIPEWFEQLLAQARADLTAANARHAAAASQRQDTQHAAAATERRLHDVAATTAGDRDALAGAARRVEQAGRNHVTAQHQLDTAPRRARRQARRDLDIAEAQLERAERHLQRTRQRTLPSVAVYDQAVAEHASANADLDRRHKTESLAANQLHGAQRRVHALHTWRRWATGHPVTIELLGDTIAALAEHHRPERTHYHELRSLIERWTNSHNVELLPHVTAIKSASRLGPQITL